VSPLHPERLLAVQPIRPLPRVEPIGLSKQILQAFEESLDLRRRS